MLAFPGAEVRGHQRVAGRGSAKSVLRLTGFLCDCAESSRAWSKEGLFGGYSFIYKRRQQRHGRDRGGSIGMYLEESQWGLLKD